MNDQPSFNDLQDLRITALFRSNARVLEAWAMAVSSACEVNHLLEGLGWSEADRIQALHRLAQLVMGAAPDGSEEVPLL